MVEGDLTRKENMTGEGSKGGAETSRNDEEEKRDWRNINECEKCSQSEHTLRAIKLKNRRRRVVLCYGCFVMEKTQGNVHPEDERMNGSATGLSEVK